MRRSPDVDTPSWDSAVEQSIDKARMEFRACDLRRSALRSVLKTSLMTDARLFDYKCSSLAMWMRRMFDHVGFNVSDFHRSLVFYKAALDPLGLGVLDHGEGWAMLGGPSGRLWIGSFGPPATPIISLFVLLPRSR